MRSKSFIVIVATVAALLLCGIAFAQEAGAPPEHKGKSLGELFAATGIVGWLLLGVSCAGTALLIEHFVNLKLEKLAPAASIEEIQRLIDAEDYDDAIAVADEDGGYMAKLLGSALRLRHAGYEHMLGALEMAAAEETFKLNAKISYLSLLGNVAPLLGLLGTVTGMISSFQVIESLAAPTPKDLAVGVYESLVNTTMGLFVAIVFLTFYFVFKNKVTKMTLQMNLEAVDVLKPLAGDGGSH